MKKYENQLAKLEAKSFEDYENDDLYKRIRSEVLNLLSEANLSLPGEEYKRFKSNVMDVLYKICGTHLDLKVLEQYVPDVLSDEDLELIIQNSALARWM